MAPELSLGDPASASGGATGEPGAVLSGSTVAALAADADHARALREAMADRFDRTEASSSPAGGSQLRVG